jgi:hypothetical protein
MAVLTSEMAALTEAVGATEPSRTYTTYLTIVALAGWALTSYDMNLLVLTIPDIARDLGLSQSQAGSLDLLRDRGAVRRRFVRRLRDGQHGAQAHVDAVPHAAAAFTGMTYFVTTFCQLTAMRMLASGFCHGGTRGLDHDRERAGPRALPGAAVFTGSGRLAGSGFSWRPGCTSCSAFWAGGSCSSSA